MPSPPSLGDAGLAEVAQAVRFPGRRCTTVPHPDSVVSPLAQTTGPGHSADTHWRGRASPGRPEAPQSRDGRLGHPGPKYLPSAIGESGGERPGRRYAGAICPTAPYGPCGQRSLLPDRDFHPAKYLDRSFFTLPLDGGGRGWGCSGAAIPHAKPLIPPIPTFPRQGGRRGKSVQQFMSQYLAPSSRVYDDAVSSSTLFCCI